MPQTLSLRETSKYVGTYRHLDEWRDIGRFEELGRVDLGITDPEDMCEPRKGYILVSVAPVQKGPTRAEILRALADEFTIDGCAHEYDCCGCRSSRASAHHVKGNVYCVEITSSRNY
jgi:hypothetical protein